MTISTSFSFFGRPEWSLLGCSAVPMYKRFRLDVGHDMPAVLKTMPCFVCLTLLAERRHVADAEWCQMSPFTGGPTHSGLTSWASSLQKTAFLFLRNGLRQPSTTLVKVSAWLTYIHSLPGVRKAHAWSM